MTDAGTRPSLRDNVGLSILNMGIQRALDVITVLVVTTLIVRSLTRQEYGMLSVVLSYGVIFNMLNVSVSAVLLRDYEKVKGRIREYMRAFVLFALAKCLVVLVLSVGIGLFLYRRYDDPAMLLVLAVNALSIMLLYVAEPFTTLLNVDFRQAMLTRVNLVSSVTNITVSAGALLVPTALYVSVKNAAVAFVGLALTAGYARRIFPLRGVLGGSGSRRLILESLVGFSLWSHLIGVMTNVIYRADLLILGWLGAPFRTVGNYNIALQMGNFTKVVPQILQYNATLGLSHTQDARRQDEITFLFVKYCFLVSLAVLVAYALLGRLAIQIVVGRDVEEIYTLGFYIVAGLCLYNTFRPLISYGTVVHRIQEVFFLAVLPSALGTLACYVILGRLEGAKGLAMGNVLGGILMTVLTLAYVHGRTGFRWRVAWVTAAEKDVFARVLARLRA